MLSNVQPVSYTHLTEFKHDGLMEENVTGGFKPEVKVKVYKTVVKAAMMCSPETWLVRKPQ